jgi:hypothetical protein
MAELMGLVCISSYVSVPQKESNKWIKMFYEQIEQQVNLDGVHMELCTRYHAEVTDQILIGTTFLKHSKQQIPKSIDDKLKKLFEFTEHTRYYQIDTVFGDNDEGYVINPYFVNEFSLYNSQLLSSNFLFDTNYNAQDKFDFRNYLIFGSSFKNTTSLKLEKDVLFKESGYCFIYDHDDKMKLSFDVGNIGDTISAAHGHSDIFHFNLQLENIPFIIDPGTYQYHSNKTFWRNYFRGITAHNTISINNKQHAVNNGRMSWINCPQTSITEFDLNINKPFCRATTNAFKLQNVTHTREFRVDKERDIIVIKDILNSETNDVKNISFFLHLHPNLNIIEDAQNTIILEHNKKRIQIKNALFTNKRLIKGDENTPLGWYSDVFNKKTETITLVLELEMQQQLEIETVINYKV